MENGGQNNPFPLSGAPKPTDDSDEQTTVAEQADFAKNTDDFQSDFANEMPDDSEVAPEETHSDVEIHWSASEAIEHERGGKWNTVAIGATVLIWAALVGLTLLGILQMMTAITTGVLALMMLIALFVVAKKPVRELDYVLTDQGITIAGTLHRFNEFRAFGVRRVGALWELVLIPVKRFGLGSTMFIHDDQGEAIVDALGARLPMEEISNSVVDRISHSLKL
jgi:hypothetical protein